MTETPESSLETTATPVGVPPPGHDPRQHRPARVYQVLAWVGIIAGVVFIVAVIFFSGVFFGRASGGYHGWHRGYQGGQMGPDGSMDDCPMMRARRNDGTRRPRTWWDGTRRDDGSGSALLPRCPRLRSVRRRRGGIRR